MRGRLLVENNFSQYYKAKRQTFCVRSQSFTWHSLSHGVYGGVELRSVQKTGLWRVQPTTVSYLIDRHGVIRVWPLLEGADCSQHKKNDVPTRDICFVVCSPLPSLSV